MFIMMAGRGYCGLECIEDQVFADISDVVQASKSHLMARGVAVELLLMAKRVDLQCEAAEYEDLSGEEDFPLDSIVVYDWWGHRTS